MGEWILGRLFLLFLFVVVIVVGGVDWVYLCCARKHA